YPTTSYPLGLVQAGTVSAPVYYEPNQLHKTKTKDEQYNEVIEYKDKEGRVVLKRVQAVPGNPTVNDVNYASTYYIYDDFGSLVCVIPPEATSQLAQEYFSASDSGKDAFLKRWTFRYTYDGRRRMTQKQVPGADVVSMVYDDRDRLVLTQDGNQRLTNRWTFTKYDALNRPVLTGIYTHISSVDQGEMQDTVNAFYESHPLFEIKGSAVHGYSNQSFPNVSSEADYLTVTYYDDYNFDTPAGIDFSYIANDLQNQEPEQFNRTRGQVTGTRIKNLVDNSWYLTVNYYDDRYRVIQSVSQNHRNGLDRITNVYDFPGRIIASKTTHQVAGATERSVTRTYEYDHAGRLIDTYHTVDDGTPVLLSRNEYNELGQVIAKKMHSEEEYTYAQQVDYRYNIRGWLTRINDSDLNENGDHDPNETVNDDYFGMQLSYENPFPEASADPQFNGNISAMRWSTNLGLGQEIVNFPDLSRPKALAYGFTYDEMNRLKGAALHALTGSTWSASDEYHEDNITYDLNGNIRTLNRTTKDGGDMDILNYGYGEGTDKHSNRLLKVTDTGD